MSIDSNSEQTEERAFRNYHQASRTSRNTDWSSGLIKTANNTPTASQGRQFLTIIPDQSFNHAIGRRLSVMKARRG